MQTLHAHALMPFEAIGGSQRVSIRADACASTLDLAFQFESLNLNVSKAELENPISRYQCSIVGAGEKAKYQLKQQNN